MSQTDSESTQCSSCGEDSTSYNARMGGYVCPECGNRWSDTTPSERVLRKGTEGDKILVEDIGECTLKHVDIDSEEIGVRDRGGTLYTLSNNSGEWMSITPTIGDGIDRESVAVSLYSDPWTSDEFEEN